MSSGRPRHVSLSGDVSGDYVVLEERSDGSLVVAPDSARRPTRIQRKPPPRLASMFGGLLPRPAPEPATVPMLLEDWGVELADHEAIDDFLLAEIDGETGFVAITTERFIFAAHARREATVVREHLLSAARNVELVGRPRRQKLRVSWHGADSVIWVPDRDAFERLYRRLAGDDAV